VPVTEMESSPPPFEPPVHVPLVVTLRSAGTKKVKIPKLWDIRIPEMSRPKSHTKQISWDDDDMKHIGVWNDIKPISVSYIKRDPDLVSLTPHPSSSHGHDTQENMSDRVTSTIISCENDVSLEKKSSYDKSAVQAVQVSVLISMPGETAGPSALGIANVSLGNGGRWRQSQKPRAL